MVTRESWRPWQKRASSGELVRLARAWDRRVECPSCNVAVGRACRTSSGHLTDHHRARRDAAGPAPYEQWRKEGLRQRGPPPHERGSSSGSGRCASSIEAARAERRQATASEANALRWARDPSPAS
ncbi:zinc finger domain-containing protein [Streptomyces sp. NBC_01207]|uniref:zinc finger domain-containing protein n=1 Tax=Streptomyces sp. NBC_01207 TaxID=2903772 RepID=UPI003FA350F9